MASTAPNRFGWVPDPEYNEQMVRRLRFKRVPIRLVRQMTKRNVFLWEAMRVAEPNWERGNQGIGDCVSWGAELACTCLLWNLAATGQIEWDREVATEAIYGGCRVEIHNGPQMGIDEDGAAGSWAAEWLHRWGVLLRKNYASVTGNPDHDLTKYDSTRAREWGYYGCGGKKDNAKLDEIARLYPVQEVAPVNSPDECEAAIDAGCTVTVASQVGFEGNRDSEGVIRRNGVWPHQMCILGKRWTDGGVRHHRLFNSWGKSVSGPDPGIEDRAISDCSWWITDDDLSRILREGDSFAFSHVQGFSQPPYNFDTDLIV